MSGGGVEESGKWVSRVPAPDCHAYKCWDDQNQKNYPPETGDNTDFPHPIRNCQRAEPQGRYSDVYNHTDIGIEDFSISLRALYKERDLGIISHLRKCYSIK